MQNFQTQTTQILEQMLEDDYKYEHEFYTLPCFDCSDAAEVAITHEDNELICKQCNKCEFFADVNKETSICIDCTAQQICNDHFYFTDEAIDSVGF